MKAVVFEEFGEVDVLKVRDDVAQPTLAQCGPLDLLIKVHSASINPIDWKTVEGAMGLFPNAIKQKPAIGTPVGLGFDVSGVVVAVGRKVSQFQQGDEIFGMADFRFASTFAEYVIISSDKVASKPAGLSHNQAASLPLAGLTSYQALFTYGQLAKQQQDGEQQKVLVIGGSGGTGILAVQMAHGVGAHVTTICSGKNVKFVKEMGADEVVDYTKVHFADVLTEQTFDVVYDCVGGQDYYTSSYPLLKKSGAFVTIVGDQEDHYFGVKNILRKGWQIGCRAVYSFATCSSKYYLFTTNPNNDDLTAIKEMVEASKLKPCIDSVFKLDDIVDAMKRSTSRRSRGKIVLEIA